MTEDDGYKSKKCRGIPVVGTIPFEPRRQDYYELEVQSYVELFDANVDDGPFRTGLAGSAYDERTERMQIMIEQALALLTTESANFALHKFFTDGNNFENTDTLGPNAVGNGLRGWAVKNVVINRKHWGWHVFSEHTGYALIGLAQTALAIKQFIADHPTADVANQPVFGHFTTVQKTQLRESYYFLNPNAAASQSTVTSCRQAIAAVDYSIDSVSRQDCFSIAKKLDELTYSDFEALLRAYVGDILDWWIDNASRNVALDGDDGRFFMYLYPDDHLWNVDGVPKFLASGYVVHNVNIAMGRAAFMYYLLSKDAGRDAKAETYLEVAKATQRMFRLGQVTCRQSDRLSVEGDWAYYITNCRPYGAHWSALVNYPNNPRHWTDSYVNWRNGLMEMEDTEHGSGSVGLNGLMMGDSMFNSQNYGLGVANVAQEVGINVHQWFTAPNIVFYNSLQARSAYLSPASRLHFYWDSDRQKYMLSSEDKVFNHDDYPDESLTFKHTPTCVSIPCTHAYPAFNYDDPKTYGISTLYGYVEGANEDGFEMIYWWYRAFLRHFRFTHPNCKNSPISDVINPYFTLNGKNGNWDFENYPDCNLVMSTHRWIAARMMWAAKKREGTHVVVPDSSPVLNSVCGSPSASCGEVPFGGRLSLTGKNFGNAKYKVDLNSQLVDAESWTTSSIALRMPKTAALKPSSSFPLIVRVRWDNGAGFHTNLDYVESNFKALWVRAPVIVSAPSTIRRRTPVTITGNFFGDLDGTVTIGGVTLEDVSWSNTEIQGFAPATVPLGLQTGEVNLGLDVKATFTATIFQAPMIATVAPANLPLGETISITGDSFDPSPGRVTVSGLDTEILSWSDTSISVRLPVLGLSAGVHEMIVIDSSSRPSNYAATVVPTTIQVHAPSLAWLSPNFGVPGAGPISLSGTFFGIRPEIGAVTFAGIPAANLQAWTNTLLTVTPPSLDFGSHRVQVMVGSLGSAQPVYYYVRPRIDFVSPSSGTGGDSVILTGVFPDIPSANDYVLLNSTIANVTSWKDSQIIIAVSDESAPGTAGAVVVNGQPGSFAFTLHPNLFSVAPYEVVSGDTITLTGTNFGQLRFDADVYIGGYAASSYPSWSNSQLQAVIPLMPNAGVVPVVLRANGTTNLGFHQIALHPAITEAIPQTVNVGSVLMITGKSFGVEGAPMVTIGGSEALLKESAAYRVRAYVPDIAAGRVPVIVTAAGFASAPYYVDLQPTINRPSTTSGDAGDQVSISGSGFGADVSAIQVAFGGVAVPAVDVTFNSSGRIATVEAKVPAIAGGTYDLTVIVNGVASNKYGFKVNESDRLTHIVAGDDFSFVARQTVTDRSATSQVRCWGANAYGQLGNGSQTASASPAVVALPTGYVTDLAAADNAVCAFVAGYVYCWGRNDRSQLGGASAGSFSTVPAKIPNLRNIERIVAGTAHFCVYYSTKTLCWGDNSFGQATQNTNDPFNPPPGVVAKPTEVSRVKFSILAAGGNTTCGVQDSGGYFHCWGDGSDGLYQSPFPKQPAVVAIGGHHICASGTWYFESGGVLNEVEKTYCWGRNDYGQHGNGSVFPQVGSFVGVQLPGNVAYDLAAGANHACAVSADQTVYCWGDNADGQVGSGTLTSPFTLPGEVIAMKNRGNLIAAGNRHNCAIVDYGRNVRCWGDGASGAIGVVAEDQAAPIIAAGFDPFIVILIISNVTPASGAEGQSVTLTGQNFGAGADLVTTNKLRGSVVLGFEY